jgi:[acyl-carrier-protein] S-malonyltransferase
MTLAILCSGQGRQHPNMFALTGGVGAAKELFVHAARLLGDDPRAMVQDAPPEVLYHNRTGQILCALQTLAAAAALRSTLLGRIVVAGYSVGEVAAWGVVGLFDAKDTLGLVAQRAEAMDAVTPPGDGLVQASVAYRDILRRVPLHFPPPPGTRLLSGIDGAPVLDDSTGLEKLAAQISQTVQWAACLEACVEAGATAFLELGPGPALSEMVASVYPGLPARSLDDFKSLNGVRA